MRSLETFGCCSHYQKCSDSGECIFSGNVDYLGCYYSKNLKAGRNFYSTKPVVSRWTEQKLFLDCYDRNFKIGHRGSNGLSYPLKEDEYNLLLEKLPALEVPVLTESENNKCIMEGTEQEPANSKVVFSVPEIEQEFVIGNYNQCYILPRYSEGIVKALQKKGIIARVEHIGSYAYRKSYVVERKTEKVEQIPEKVQQTQLKAMPEIGDIKTQYKQLTIFDMVAV